jgi:O-acetyl-ADP-ribose deacetylase (regulator of RNase III)
MPVEYRIGDLFAAADLPALAQGCNCAGAMGRGIAAQFRTRWPQMYEEYREQCFHGVFTPGSVFMYQQDEASPVIFNLGTQSSWRTGAVLNWVHQSITAMVKLAAEHDIAAIGMPRIGAGLGRLPWPKVDQVLHDVAGATPVRLVVYTLEEQQ